MHSWPVFNECLFDSYDSYTVLSLCVCAHKLVCVLYWEEMMKHADIFYPLWRRMFSFHFSTTLILNSLPSSPSHQPERPGKCHSPPQTSSMTFPTSFTEKPRLQLTTPSHQTANQTINMITNPGCIFRGFRKQAVVFHFRKCRKILAYCNFHKSKNRKLLE